jgi:hypothetical protein
MSVKLQYFDKHDYMYYISWKYKHVLRSRTFKIEKSNTATEQKLPI